MVLYQRIFIKKCNMSEHAPKFTYSNRGQKISIFLLVFVVVITVWLAIFNTINSNKIQDMQATLEEHKNTVKELKAEKKVYVYELKTLHKNILDTLDERSKISKYISHLQQTEDKFNLQLRGFDLVNGEITTKAIFDTNDTGVSYNKAVRFIWDYRNSDKSLFDLEFISFIESTDLDVKIPLQFTLKK